MRLKEEYAPEVVGDDFIGRLSTRFEPDPQAPRHFHTVNGVGYLFELEGERL